jgi:HSP20 family protein
MSDFFDSFIFDSIYRSNSTANFGRTSVDVDVEEDSNAVYLKVDLPGVSLDDVNINVEKSVLAIKGERKREEREDGKYYSKECRYGSFSRTFELSKSVDVDNITAVYDKGVLTLTLPKKEQVKTTKEIKIIKV